MLGYERRVVTFVVLAMAFAFGLGLQRAQAQPLSWCTELCVEKCADHDGCASAQAIQCTCYYTCNDGSQGDEYCTLS